MLNVRKNDLKNSPPKCSFFEDFLNFSKQTRQKIRRFAIFIHTLENTLKQTEKKKREREIRSRVVVSVVFMVVVVE